LHPLGSLAPKQISDNGEYVSRQQMFSNRHAPNTGFHMIYVESVSAPPKSLSIHFDNSRYSVIDVFQAQIPMLKVFQLHPFHSCRCLDMLQTQAPDVEVAPPKHFNIIKTS